MKRIVVIGLALTLLLILGTQNDSRAENARAQFDTVMNEVLTEYLKITGTLATNQTTGVAETARKIETLAKRLDYTGITGEQAVSYRLIAERLVPAASELARASDIAQMREALKKLSQPMAIWIHRVKPAGVNVVFCPMYPGSWAQDDSDIRNPYYGPSMLTCGEIVDGPNSGQAGGHMQHGQH